jgi:hypothetical protein
MGALRRSASVANLEFGGVLRRGLSTDLVGRSLALMHKSSSQVRVRSLFGRACPMGALRRAISNCFLRVASWLY